MLTTLQIGEILVVGESLPLERDASVGINAPVEETTEKPKEPLQQIKKIEKKEERLHHLRRMDPLVVEHPFVHMRGIQFTHKQHAEEVDGDEALGRQYAIDEDLHA